jgi:hypothetical protein
MADDTTKDTADKPLAPLVEAEKKIDPPMSDEPMPAVERLRAFEDEKLGKDAPRFNGAVERGVGSLWHRMSDADKAYHAKLEKLVEVEGKLAAAHSALIAAAAEHEAALAAVESHNG